MRPIPDTPKWPTNRSAAFSLLELLVVIAVIVVLLALGGPAINGAQQGMALATAGAAFEAQLVDARESAISRRSRVESRFYKCKKDGTDAYRGIQNFIQSLDGSMTPLAKPVWLPTGLVISEDALYSSLLSGNNTVQKEGTGLGMIPSYGTSYTAKTFEFLPDGSTSIPDLQPPPFFTIYPEGRADPAAANFYTIQIDPVTGKLRTHRP